MRGAFLAAGTPSVVLPSTPVAFEESPPEAGDPHFRPMSPTTQFAAEILCGLSPLPPAAGSHRGNASEVRDVACSPYVAGFFITKFLEKKGTFDQVTQAKNK
jgi:hypothetical protein